MKYECNYFLKSQIPVKTTTSGENTQINIKNVTSDLIYRRSFVVEESTTKTSTDSFCIKIYVCDFQTLVYRAIYELLFFVFVCSAAKWGPKHIYTEIKLFLNILNMS